MDWEIYDRPTLLFASATTLHQARVCECVKLSSSFEGLSLSAAAAALGVLIYDAGVYNLFKV